MNAQRSEQQKRRKPVNKIEPQPFKTDHGRQA